MKHKMENGNIIEKKETNQGKMMGEKEETERWIVQNHNGIGRFE